MIYPALAKLGCSDEYHASPPVPVDSLRTEIDKVVDAFEVHGVGLIAVFDGRQHSMKGSVLEERESAAANNKAKLLELLAKADASDYDTTMCSL